MKRPVILLVLILLSLAIWTYQNQAAEEHLGIAVANKHKGVCWVGSRNPLEGWELDTLGSFGVSHISQTPFGWQADPNLPDIKWESHSDKMWWGESLKGMNTTTVLGRQKGIESILKPHLWVRGSWPGTISMKNEKDWAVWFGQYTDFILYFARFAEENQIPILCIGTELEGTSKREEDWRQVIREVRSVYKGELVYAANFTEYQQIEFWDALDYIGIQAYFPLSEKHNPDLAELISSWEKKNKEIEKTIRQFKKPVIFTELGYCNTEDAAIEPWVWPNERKGIPISEEVQALCYEAFFQTAWKKDWLAGVYFWKWYPQLRERDPDFTPQNKMAQLVMKNYFSGKRQNS